MTGLLLAAAIAAAGPRPITHGMSIVDSAAGPLVGVGGVAIDPSTGSRGEPRYHSAFPGKGRVVPVPGTDARSPLLRYVPDGVVAWDAESGRDLGRVLAVDALEAVLTFDAAVAVVRTPTGIEGWSTATGRRLWRAADPFPADKGGVPWWRVAGGGVVVPTHDAVWLLDPATGAHAWTLTREDPVTVRIRGAVGSCVVGPGGIREGTCPPFVPTPMPPPAPGAEATDALAALYPPSAPNARLVARYRARDVLAPWPERAGHADPAPVWGLAPRAPLPAGHAAPAAPEPSEPSEPPPHGSLLHADFPEPRPAPLPLRAGRPTIVLRGDGDVWPSCDALWIDPPAPVREPGGFDRVRYDLGDYGHVPVAGAEPITAFDDLESARVFGLRAGEALVVDAAGLVRWRGASGAAEIACRLVLREALGEGAPLPTRAVPTRWAYRPPTPTPRVVAVADGVVAWGRRGLVVLDDDGRLRWSREGASLDVYPQADRVVVVDRVGKEQSRVTLALADGREVPEGDLTPAPRTWTAVGDGGRVASIATGSVGWLSDGPLAWFVGDVPIAWVPGWEWGADVRGKLGYAWHDGAIVAWTAP